MNENTPEAFPIESIDAVEPAAPAVVPAKEATEATAEPVAQAAPAEVAAELKTLFPALFAGGHKPLKLRIQADIQQRAPGRFTKAQLSAFFRRYTGATGYLIALTKAEQRFDLDGQPAGEISEEHKVAAREELKRRRGLREEREAAMEAGRRQRIQLLRDFERTTLTLANFCALKGVAQEELPALLEIARKEAAEMPPPRRDDRPQRGRPEGRPGDRRDGRGGRGEGRPDARPLSRRNDGPRERREGGAGPRQGAPRKNAG